MASSFVQKAQQQCNQGILKDLMIKKILSDMGHQIGDMKGAQERA
jgi:hypothetical protein